MKNMLILIAGPLLLAPLGYFGGQTLLPPPELPDPAVEMDAPPAEEELFKMPLGGFTIQVRQPDRVLNIVIDLDVYLAGADEFDRLNGAEGRNRLRDATITEVVGMTESSLWLKEGEEALLAPEELAEKIVRRLYRRFNAVRTARINAMVSLNSKRF